MQLRRIEKGSLLPDGKYKSLQGHWFGSKKISANDTAGANQDSHGVPDDKVYIGRDTLVKMKCKRGKTVSSEYYRVLGIYSKHYNKWFVHWDGDRVEFKSELKYAKQYKLMMRMVKDGEDIKELELERSGN